MRRFANADLALDNAERHYGINYYSNIIAILLLLMVCPAPPTIHRITCSSNPPKESNFARLNSQSIHFGILEGAPVVCR